MKHVAVVVAAMAVVCFAGMVGAQTPISTVGQLQEIGTSAEYPINGNYLLTQDIDATGTSSWNSGEGFDPLGRTQSCTSSSTFSFTIRSIPRNENAEC